MDEVLVRGTAAYILIGMVSIPLLIWAARLEHRMKHKTKTEDGNLLIECSTLMCGNAPQGIDANIITNNENVIIETKGFKKVIPHEDIIEVSIGTADQLKEEDGKFSFGKAAIGIALIGGFGAIGGLAGKKSAIPKTITIAYCDNDEIDYAIFLQKMPKKPNNKGIKSHGSIMALSHTKMKQVIDKRVVLKN